MCKVMTPTLALRLFPFALTFALDFVPVSGSRIFRLDRDYFRNTRTHGSMPYYHLRVLVFLHNHRRQLVLVVFIPYSFAYPLIFGVNECAV